MINFSIFNKGKKDADYHRQQVSERGILERIDKVLDEISEEGLKEIYELEERIKQIVNDPRTRMALGKFNKEEKPAVKPIDVTPKETPKKTKQTPKKTKEAPKEEPVEVDAEVPVEEPIEVPVEEPKEEVVETPIEEPVEVPAEENVEVPVEETKEETQE